MNNFMENYNNHFLLEVGCSLIKSCTDCILQQCKFVILSTKPPLCIDEDFKVVDLFAKFIEAAVNCPGTALPKSLPVEREADGYGKLEIGKSR